MKRKSRLFKMLVFMLTTSLLLFSLPLNAFAGSGGKNLNVIFTSQEYPAGSWPKAPLKTMNCGQTCAAMLETYYMYKDCTLTNSDLTAIKANLKESIKKIDDWLYQEYKLPINGYRGSGTNEAILADILTSYSGLSDAKVCDEWSLQDIKDSIDNGNPVIVHVKRVWGNEAYYKNTYIDHFILIKGYDDNNVIINDPGRTYGSNRTYTFKEFNNIRVGIKAVIVDKHQDNSSQSSNSQSGSAASVPGVPSGLSTGSIGSDYVSLLWNSVSGAENYQVLCSDRMNGNYWGVGASDANSIVVNGLSPGIKYWFKIKAHNEAGDSAYSSVLSVTTIAQSQSSNNQSVTAVSVPEVPSGLRVVSTGSNYINLGWNSISGAENYQVFCCDRQDGNYWGVGASDANSIVVNGLSPGIKYWFKIKAHNEAGDSGLTSSVNATTNR